MYTLPTLSYDYAALEPHIDAQTMEIHHTKHHQWYVDKLNKALDGVKIGSYPANEYDIEELLARMSSIPEEARNAVRNNGWWHLNHSMFWELMSPDESEISNYLTEQLTKQWESVDAFKDEFSTLTSTLFGSGWTWLVKTVEWTLAIKQYANQDNPVMYGETPILGIDVREHAYYLKHQNRRPDYINARWNVVDWDQVEKNMKTVK